MAKAVEVITAGELSTELAVTKEPDAEPETGSNQKQAQEDGGPGHTCSECGMSFQRRYSLIMHTLKHEKARGYKCSVSIHVGYLVSHSIVNAVKVKVSL